MANSQTDTQWEKWGSQNPYLGVLGVETSDVLEDNVKERFFETGREHIDGVMATLTRVFGGLERTEAALDFGCGVGRLLPPLAERFATVHAIDISPSMLDLARNNTTGFDNIQFHRNLNSFEGKLDLVHSFIVLQHIRPGQGMPIIAKLMTLVRPGGVFALHVTTGDNRPRRAMANWMRYRFPPLHYAYNLARRRPLSEPITEMNKYIPFDILELAKRAGYDGAYTQSFDQNGHRGIIFFGQKAPAATDQPHQE